MFTSAFDASGTDNTPTLTVAGFVSSVKDWDDFSLQWEKRLAKDGIVYFRAAEFAHSTDQFKEGWKDNEARRRKLSADLMEILLPRVYRKFGCTIVNRDFGKLNKSLQEDYVLTAYSLAGRTCIVLIRDWERLERMATSVESVFEEGDADQEKLRRQLVHDLGYEPNFRPKKDKILKDGSIKKRFVPLQAADWLAFEIHLMVKKYGTTQGLPNKSDLRWPMQQFLDKVGPLGIYGAEELGLLNDCLRQSKDLMEWWKELGL